MSWKKHIDILVAAAIVLFHVITQWNVFTTPTDMNMYAHKYSQSQYVLGEDSPQKIDDAEVYIYAAQAYMRGEDPTQVNFEHPPLGKYLFGISYALTRNVLMINPLLLFGILSLLSVLMKQLKLGQISRIIILVFFGMQYMLHVHLGMGLMDLMTLFFSVLFFYALFRTQSRWHGVIVGLIVGALASLKYPFPSIGVYGIVAGFWYWKEKRILQIFPLGISAICVYLLTYIAYFIRHPNPMDFIRFEWFRYKWWTEFRTIPKYLIVQVLFFGKFAAWWQKGITYVEREWTILWPLTFISHLIAMVAVWKNSKLFLLFLYSTGFFVLYAIGGAPYGRYIQQSLPFWMIITATGIQTVLQGTNALNKKV